MLTILKRLIPLILLLVLWAGSSAGYEVGDWTVDQLTDNGVLEANPMIEGNRIVWIGLVPGEGWQVFLRENGVTSRVSDNNLGNTAARVSDALVAWSTWTQVYYYDGTVHVLTPSFEQHNSPEVSGGRIVWLGEGGNPFRDVFLFDGVETTQLTDTPDNKADIQISGEVVTWWAAGSNAIGNIFYHDGTEVHQLTDDTSEDKYPKVSHDADGLHLTYRSYFDGQWDIMHFDGTTITNLSSTPDIDESEHQTCGARTTWRRYDAGQYSIWLHDGSVATQIYSASSIQTDPVVSETLVAWVGGSWGDILVHDGTTVTQLTDNNQNIDENPQVWGNTVVWAGQVNLSAAEIFMAYMEPPVISAVPDLAQMSVHGAHPNPFNPSTDIVFSTRVTEAVGVRIFDFRGRLVADLGSRNYAPGTHAVTWTGRNDRGLKVPSGVYFYRVTGAEVAGTGKVTLLE